MEEEQFEKHAGDEPSAQDLAELEHARLHAEGIPHSHSHTHGEAVSGQQALALLQYMLDHNIHHAAELSDLAGQFSGEVEHQLLHAVESFDQGNGYLSAALELLKKQ